MQPAGQYPRAIYPVPPPPPPFPADWCNRGMAICAPVPYRAVEDQRVMIADSSDIYFLRLEVSDRIRSKPNLPEARPPGAAHGAFLCHCLLSLAVAGYVVSLLSESSCRSRRGIQRFIGVTDSKWSMISALVERNGIPTRRRRVVLRRVLPPFDLVRRAKSIRRAPIRLTAVFL